MLASGSGHALGQIDHAHELVQAGDPCTDQAHAVVGQGLETVGARRSEDLARRRTPRDQSIDIGVDLEQLEDRLPASVALVVAFRAANGAKYLRRLAGI